MIDALEKKLQASLLSNTVQAEVMKFIRDQAAENENLRRANLDCVDHYNDAVAELRRLQATIAETTNGSV
jgi:hypothetical protein